MKISCPGCGKTYQVPQGLIDEILRKHRTEPVDIDAALFLPAASPPIRTVTVPRQADQSNKGFKIVLVVVTFTWLVGNTLFGLAGFADAVNRPMTEYSIARSYNDMFITSFMWSTILTGVPYAVIMVVLGVVWLSTRK
jgi:hypothetical protein